jgi:hypothetical protein
MKQTLLLFLFFTLKVFAQPSITTYNVCDDNNDGFAIFDLTTKIPEILANDNPVDFSITFHETLTDAQTNSNAITTIGGYTNVQPFVQTIFINKLNNATNLSDLLALDIIVQPSPIADVAAVTACFNQGVALFDLGTTAELIWAQNNATPNLISVSFHNSLVNAMNQINPLPYQLASQDNFTVIYISIKNTITGCSTFTPLSLIGENCNNNNCQTPTNLFIEPVSNNIYTLDWSTVNGATSYEVFLTGINSPEPTPNTTGISSTVSNYTFSNLNCGTAFKCYVRSVCSTNDTSPWSNAIIFETPDCSGGTCVVPTNLATNSITLNSATLNWSTNNNGDTSWEIYIVPQGSPAPTSTITGSVIANVNPFIIVGLNCGTSYTYYIRAACTDQAFSDWSVGANFQTIGCGTAVTVSTTTLTPTQILNTVVLNEECGTPTNIVTQGICGIGYFNNNDGDFPFEEGLILRSGNANLSGGSYTGGNSLSSTCSNLNDGDLNNVLVSTGNASGTINDATFMKFDFVPTSNLLTFNFIFASNEYGNYQCNFSDVFGFILTDLTTGDKQNIAVVPNTTIPISTTTVRNNLYNNACPSVNAQYFGSFNPNNPESDINFVGQTVPLTAFANVIPNRQYSLKLAVGDYNDSMFDSAVFIEGGSLAFGNQCNDNIQLMAFVDTNTNGIKDTGEVAFSQGTFNFVVNNDGITTENQSSNGTFYIFPENLSNSYDISFLVYPELASFFSNSTTFTDIVFDENGDNIYYFPITNTQPYNDVEVSVSSFGNPNPGFNYNNYIIYKNNGLTPVSGILQFNYDSILTVLSISQAGTIATSNGFAYNYIDLQPGETRIIYVNFIVPTIPIVSLGQLVTNTAISINDGDINLTNNTSEFIQTIIGSYDPNDKLEAHGGKIVFDEFDSNDYLYYTIRFQNTGTANAQFVRLEDTLNEMLDETSVRMITSSHNYVLTRNNNQLTWQFDQINLPPQIVNDTGSNGFVQFKIKPKAGFALGDVIPNTAEIYFDFNPAIITNTFETEFVETLGNTQFNASSIGLYPNPAKENFTIGNSGTENITQITIYEVSGKRIFQQTKSFETQTTIPVSTFAKGIYLVEVVSENKSKVTKKLVVK